MSKLYVKHLDAEALVICAAAAVNSAQVPVKRVSSVCELPATLRLTLPSLGLPCLAYNKTDSIQGAIPAARLLGGASVVPEGSGPAAASADLLERAGRIIEYGTDAGACRVAAAAAGGLNALLKSAGQEAYLFGDRLSLADIHVAAHLLCVDPGRLRAEQPALANYTERVVAGATFQAALATLGTDAAGVREAAAAAALAASAAAPRLPQPGARNVLITSALPYVNNVPHLGNIIGCVLSADVYARFCRARGHNAVFVCGTDEYGTATETKALEEGVSCQEVCDRYHAVHAQTYAWFDIAFDHFGRTPTRAQTEICQGIFADIHERGFTVTRTGEQLFSRALGRFLADRFVVGTCPRCGYEDARGDQCDSCGALLNPTELVRPRCKVTGTVPELRETRHVYIDLPRLAPKLEEYIAATSAEGGWSANCVATTEGWLRGGLKERCITRDLKWGTPVPLDGFRDKVFYVWFDAPIGYVSITANYTPEWRRWWHAPRLAAEAAARGEPAADVELVQFMGKDNVTFHTIIFPSTLLGSGQAWTMMRKISVTEYLNYEGGKFSKSRGTGVFGTDAAATGIPASVYRYYLLAGRPEARDTDFRWAELAARNNSELLENFGNFVNRALAFVTNKLGGTVPDGGTEEPPAGSAVAALSAEIAGIAREYVAALESLRLRDGAALLLQASGAGNKFLQDTKFWGLPPAEQAPVVAAALGLVKVLAALAGPYMPAVSRKMVAMLGGAPEWGDLGAAFEADAAALHRALPAGHRLGKPELLFAKIEEARVAELQAQFCGASVATPAASDSGAGSNQPKQQAAGDRKRGKAAVAGSGAAPSTSLPPDAPGGEPRGAPDKTRAALRVATDGGGANAVGAPTGAPTAAGKGGAGTGKGGAAAAAPAAAARPADISRVDLRVGVITAAQLHPEADGLYIEDIECGDTGGAARVVVSGLARHVPLAEMAGRRVVVVANLKPANLRGVRSHAMVLAATGADGTVELVEPPDGVAAGDRVTVAGYEGAGPDGVLNPKHKVFDAVKAELTTDKSGVACYRGIPLMTHAGPCCARTVANGAVG